MQRALWGGGGEHIRQLSAGYDKARVRQRSLAKQVESTVLRLEKARMALRELDIDNSAAAENALNLRQGFCEKMARLADNHAQMIRQSFRTGIDKRVNGALDRAEAHQASIDTFCGARCQNVFLAALNAHMSRAYDAWRPHFEEEAKKLEQLQRNIQKFDGARTIQRQISHEETLRLKQGREEGRMNRFQQRLRFEKSKQDIDFLQYHYKTLYHEAMARSLPSHGTENTIYGTPLLIVYHKLLRDEYELKLRTFTLAATDHQGSTQRHLEFLRTEHSAASDLSLSKKAEILHLLSKQNRITMKSRITSFVTAVE